MTKKNTILTVVMSWLVLGCFVYMSHAFVVKNLLPLSRIGVSTSTSTHQKQPLMLSLAKTAKADSDDKSKNEASLSNQTQTTTTTKLVEDLSDAAKSLWQDIRDAPERFRLEQELILMGASYDRGFGASPLARQKVEDMIQQLADMQPVDNDVTVNIDGRSKNGDSQASPLQGVWRLVWTTAQNILVLNGSPFATAGAIYLVVEPPIVTSIIDFVPRYESLFPVNRLPHTLTRAKTRSKASTSLSSTRTIRLTQESVNVKTLDILGRKTGSALPALNLKVPKLPGASDSDESQRALRVLFLDGKMLITKQDEPGGINVFVKVDDAEP